MNTLNKTSLFLVITLMTLATFSLDTKAEQPYYSLDYKDASNNQIHIKAHLPLAPPYVLTMTEHGPIPEQWGDFIENVNAYDNSGKPLTVNKISKREWQIKGTKDRWATISYSVDLSHEKLSWPGGIDGVAFQRESGIFATGRAIFLMSQAANSAIKVDVELPENWSFHAPWKQIESGSYVAQNNHTLSESITMAGELDSFQLDTKGMDVEFVLAGNRLIEQKNTFKERAEKLLTYYTELLGGLPISPSPSNESKMLVVINEHEQTDGEVIGNHISMLMNPSATSEEQLITWFLYAHEFFHLWNGRTIRVDSPRADWFKEGVTNYYTFKGLIQTGIIPPQAVFMVSNHLLYQRYINDPGYGQLSPSQAAIKDKDGHWGLVYGGGFFAGLELDLAIRQQSNHTKSLDDLMRSMYEFYAGKNEYYSSDDIEKLLDSMQIKNHQSIFENYIKGTRKLDVASIFERFGFDVELQQGQLIIQQKDELTLEEDKLQKGFFGDEY